MDFHLSKEHLLVRKMYREFAETEVKPLAEELDEEERFPMETVEKMAKLGMMGIYFPKQYGGAGGDVLSYAMCVEELAKVCGTTAVVVSAHTSLCCAPIFENGTEEQKMKYLPDLLSGRKIGAFGLTEPGAGTDASGQQTIAVKNENGDYVLNGSKCFITNGNVASTFVVFAMTDKSKGNHGISAFIVESTFPGFSTGKHEKKMGIRGSSMPHDTAACASTKRMKHLKATSGFFISAKLPQVLTTPITKNSTSSAYPTAFNPSLIFTITFQTPPPLKDSGEVLMSCQISASLPFHISSAEFKLSTIQFPLPIQNHLLREEQGERYHAVHPAAFFSR